MSVDSISSGKLSIGDRSRGLLDLLSDPWGSAGIGMNGLRHFTPPLNPVKKHQSRLLPRIISLDAEEYNYMEPEHYKIAVVLQQALISANNCVLKLGGGCSRR